MIDLELSFGIAQSDASVASFNDALIHINHTFPFRDDLDRELLIRKYLLLRQRSELQRRPYALTTPLQMTKLRQYRLTTS